MPVSNNPFDLSIILVCKLPPEFCEFGQKDASACKKWLGETHPTLYQEVYGEVAQDIGEEEEKKADGEEEGEAKPKKKVKFGKEVGVITVYKQKRGGRKTISQIVGFEHYVKDLKGLASKFGKKFSLGATWRQMISMVNAYRCRVMLRTGCWKSLSKTKNCPF